MNTEKQIDFPPLPEPTWMMPSSIAGQWEIPGAFTSVQMRDYVAADRAQRQAALTAWQDSPTIDHADAIRAQRQAGQELYGWQVAGTRSLHTGEFAEADAKAEAARIGWMGQAFPLYTAPQPVAQAEPEPAAKAGDTLEDNVRHMLDKCPYTVRDMSGERTGKRWVEDLTGSLVLTFLGMQSRLDPPPPAQDHIGDAAGKVAPPPAQEPLTAEAMWEIWEESVDEAERTGMLAPFIFGRTLEAHRGISLR